MSGCQCQYGGVSLGLVRSLHNSMLIEYYYDTTTNMIYSVDLRCSTKIFIYIYISQIYNRIITHSHSWCMHRFWRSDGLIDIQRFRLVDVTLPPTNLSRTGNGVCISDICVSAVSISALVYTVYMYVYICL